MVATSVKPQRLSTRADPDEGRNGEWGIPQIITPVIVGVVLVLLFTAYVIWQRRFRGKRLYDYQQVRSDWTTRIERMFVPRRKRHRVVHSSVPVTLDDSMRTSGFTFDFSRRSRQCRSDSTDSQTPLTSTSYAFDYPPSKLSDYPPNRLSDSPPPVSKRRTVRWWWLFGSRPQQIKSAEPGVRWRVDDPDGSSTEHGHTSQGHRHTGTLEPLREELEDGGNEVIRIGENFTSVASTPVTQHFPEQTRSIRGIPTVPEEPESSDSRAPILAVSAPLSNPGTPASANRSLPPSYEVSQSQTRYSSAEDNVRLALSGPYMALPPPARAAGYSSPRAFHGRDLSSDSILATQPPMVTPSMY